MVKTLFILIWIMTHPVHVSLLSIDYVPDQKIFSVFLKLYYDDFLLDSGIGENGKQALKFTGDDEFTGKFMTGYINDKIKIIADDRQLSGALRGYSLEDNELKINLSFDTVNILTTLTVKNLIMTKLYSDQANMLIVRVNDFEKGVKMTPEETEQTFIIK